MDYFRLCLASVSGLHYLGQRLLLGTGKKGVAHSKKRKVAYSEVRRLVRPVTAAEGGESRPCNISQTR